ncbi:MAG TPA: tetratricopeptide repeat protein [Polyangiaceae bacterium]|jgi:Tfp pilus assembly protein PilF
MDPHLKQLLHQAREHYDRSEFDKAEPLLRQVLSKTDQFADVYNMLGVIAHSRGNLPMAETHFERAVGLNPNYTEARINLSVTYNDLGKYEAARAAYSQTKESGSSGAAQVDPFVKGKIANMHADLSQAYLDAGMPAQAILELEKAVALCPTFADLRTRLAALYRDQGNPALAKEQLEQAKVSNPKYVQARNALAVILLGEHNYALAEAELEAVLAEDPQNRTAQMYLRLARSEQAKLAGEPGSA